MPPPPPHPARHLPRPVISYCCSSARQINEFNDDVRLKLPGVSLPPPEVTLQQLEQQRQSSDTLQTFDWNPNVATDLQRRVAKLMAARQCPGLCAVVPEVLLFGAWCPPQQAKQQQQGPLVLIVLRWPATIPAAGACTWVPLNECLPVGEPPFSERRLLALRAVATAVAALDKEGYHCVPHIDVATTFYVAVTADSRPCAAGFPSLDYARHREDTIRLGDLPTSNFAPDMHILLQAVGR